MAHDELGERGRGKLVQVGLELLHVAVYLAHGDERVEVDVLVGQSERLVVLALLYVDVEQLGLERVIGGLEVDTASSLEPSVVVVVLFDGAGIVARRSIRPTLTS